jgi:hypothetical protein
MMFRTAFSRVRSLALLTCLSLLPLAAQAGNVTLAWDASPGTNSIANYKIYYGSASATYTNSVSAGTNLTATVSNLVQGGTYYFAATATDTYGLESDYSSEVSTTIPVPLTNQPPTINALASTTINESAGLQTVSLAGITAGATNESQTLTITASSSNTGLIPTPTVSYTSPNTSGSLSFTPVAYASGVSTITVTVNDGGASNNITSRTFTVTVNSVNDVPTLNTLANVTVNENATLQTVSLSGIGSGAANESQTLTVTASSSNPSVVPTPTVTYTSPAASGSISFTPVASASGSATITVTVNDGGASNNLISRTFTVTVNPVNDVPTLNTLANMTINENAALQTVNLAGIGSGAANESQTLTVTATSSNTGLIPTPTVAYTSPGTTGSISFTPVASASGSSTITVTVNDGGASNNVISRTFTVTVNPVNDVPTLNTLADMTINEGAAQQIVNLSGISSGSANESQTLTVTASSSNVGLIPTPAVTYASPGASGSISFTPVALASGSATITVTVNDGGTSNNVVSRTFTVTVNSVNQAPTLNALANMNLNENAALQTVNLSGIGSGAANESQTLTVTASSSDTSVIPTPAVTYTSPGATGSISFTPVAYASGSSTITVTVNDGGASNNVISRTFTVTVGPVNQAPTLNALANVTVNENASLQTVNLAGITSGAVNESQTLTVTASSSNTGLIPTPSVTYSSPDATGSIAFTPVASANGSAIITVTVSDGGASNNVISRTFTVTVNPVNDAPTLNSLANLTINENAGAQTVNLAGIGSGAANESQTLTVTATSSNTGLIPTPAVTYTSPGATGSIRFTPVASANGTATITVTVNDGGASNNVVSRTFTVTVNHVNVAPTITAIPGRVIAMDASTPAIAFTVGDTETAAASLTLSATSDNASLVLPEDIVFGGSGASRTVTVSPQAGQTGTANITITVSDGTDTASSVLQLNVRTRPAAPGAVRVASTSL